MAGRVILLVAFCLPLAVRAQTSLSQVGLIAAPSVASQPVPAAQTFTVSQTGSYTITLTDLQIPAPLAGLSLAVVSSSAAALQLSTSATTASAAQTVSLQPGPYTVQVLAAAAASSVGGTFSVAVTTAGGTAVPLTPATGGSSANVFVGAVGPPPSAVSGQTALQTQFTVSDAGTYQLTLTDLAFPAALASGAFAVALWNVATPTPLLLNEPSVGPGTLSIPAPLTAGTYQLVVLAQASAPALAGLYSVKIAGGSSGTSTALATTVAVGNLPAPVQFIIPSAENLSLSLNDLATPATLAPGSLQAVLVEGAGVLQAAAAAGTYTIQNAPAGTAQLFVSAQPGSTAGEGSCAAVVTAGSGGSSQTLLDVAQVVTDSSHYGYTYPTTLAAAGSYQLQINDYQLPAALSGLNVSVEQNGVLLASSTLAAGTAMLSPTPQAGALNIIAFAAPTTSAGGLFGLQLSGGSSGATAYQGTQGVGTAFHAQSVSVASAATYKVSLADLGFPASFGQLDLIVTGGRQLLGEIDGSGSFSFSATPGTYAFNVLAHTGTAAGGGSVDYGMYGLQATATSAAAATTDTSTTSHGGGGAISPDMLLVLAGALLWRKSGARLTATSGRQQTQSEETR